MSQDLQAALDWNSLCEKNAVTVISEYGCSDASFMTNLLLIKHVLKNHGICLILFNKTFQHFHQIASKFGVNLSNCKEKGQLHVVELLKETNLSINSNMTSGMIYEGEGLCKRFAEIRSCIENMKVKFEHFLLLIDELTVLTYLGVPTKLIVNLVENCRYLSKSNGGCFVVTLHDNQDEGDEDLTFLHRLLQHSCDTSVHISELATGYSRDINGQIILKFFDRNNTEKVEGKDIKLHFKLEDKRVLTFAPGMSASVL